MPRRLASRVQLVLPNLQRSVAFAEKDWSPKYRRALQGRCKDIQEERFRSQASLCYGASQAVPIHKKFFDYGHLSDPEVKIYGQFKRNQAFSRRPAGRRATERPD